MSTQTTSRAQRGGNATRGARAGQFQATRGRANSRGSSAARARGRARGGSNHNGPSNGDAGGAGGLLQKLREGTTQRSAAEGTPTGGRGTHSHHPWRFSILAVSIPGLSLNRE